MECLLFHLPNGTMTYSSQNIELSDFMYHKVSHSDAFWTGTKISFSLGLRALQCDIPLQPGGAFCDWKGHGEGTWPPKLPSAIQLIPG